MKAEIYKDKAGYWRWRLRAGNHKIVAESGEGYSARYKAAQALDRLAAYASSRALHAAIKEARG